MELRSGLAAQILVSSIEASSLVGLHLSQSLHQSSLLNHAACSWEIRALLVLEISQLTSLYLSFLISKNRDNISLLDEVTVRHQLLHMFLLLFVSSGSA